MRELWKSIVETSGAKFYGLVLGIVSLSITARWLGPEGRGIFAAVTTWVTLTGTVGHLSMGQVALHRAATSREESWLPSVLGSLFAFTAVMACVGWLVVAILYVATKGAIFGGISLGYVLLGFLMLPLTLWEQYGSNLLMAVDRLSVYNRAQVIGRTCGVAILALLVVVLGWGVKGAFITAILAQAIVAGWGIRCLLQKAQWAPRPNWSVVKELVGGGLRLHLSALGAFLFTTSDILMVQYYRGARETGYYQLAGQLINIMLILPQAASLVLYAKSAVMGPDEAWKYNRRILVQITAGMCGVSVIAALLAPYVIPLVAGHAFEPSVKVFQLLLLALIGMTLSIVMAPQWISRGLFWQTSAITLALGLLNVLGNIVLIPRYGMYAAAWTTIGCYCISIVVTLAMAGWVSRRSALALSGA